MVRRCNKWTRLAAPFFTGPIEDALADVIDQLIHRATPGTGPLDR
jgi:hypothetical protein